MRDEILFSERQHFNRWLLIAIMIFPNGIVLGGFVSQVFFGNTFGNNPMSDIGLSILLVLLMSLTVLMFSIRLETIITRETISVRFYPVQIKFRVYEWDNFAQVSIRTYSPLTEYGGWGMKGFGKDKALNMQGDEGLQLVFNDGRRLLIGTQKRDELADVLGRLSI